MQGTNLSVERKRSEDSRYSEWKAPKYEEMDDDLDVPPSYSRKSSGQQSRNASGNQQSAEDFARDYESVLPAFVPELHFSDINLLPSAMSPRITDVVDESLVPLPLRLSTAEDSQPSSHFSSSSSEADKLQNDNRPSLRSRARKAFQSRKSSQEAMGKMRPRSNTSKAADVSQESHASELIPPTHASNQHGISDIHDNLTSLHGPLKTKAKLESAKPRSTAIPRELRSPASPISPYQKNSKKTFGETKGGRSPKSPSSRVKFSGTDLFPRPKKDEVSASPIKGGKTSIESESMGKKLASAFQNGAMAAVGLNRGKEELRKNEERREQMKKKIVIVK